MKKKNSLKQYFTMNMLLSSVIPVVLIILVLVPVILSNLLNEDRERSSILSESISKDIENTLMIQTASVADIYSQIYRNRFISEKEINDYLQSVVNDSGYFETIQILDNKGIVKHINSSNKAYLGLDMSNESYFKESWNHATPFWSPVYYSSNTSNITVSYTRPADGDFIVANLNINRISQYVSSMKRLDHSFVALIDQNGRYVSHENMKLIYEKQTDKNYQRYLDALEKGNSNIEIYYNGMKMMSNIVRMDQPKWIVAVIRPVREIMRPVIVMIAIVLTGFFLSVLLVFIMAYFGNKKWFLSFHEIKNAILGKAMLKELNNIPEQPFTELNELMNAFQSAMIVLSDRESKLEDKIVQEQILSDLSSLLVKEDYENLSDTIHEVLNKLASFTEAVAYHVVLLDWNRSSLYYQCSDGDSSTLPFPIKRDELYKELSAHCEDSQAEMEAELEHAISGYIADTESVYLKGIKMESGFLALISENTRQNLERYRVMNEIISELIAHTAEKAMLVNKLKNLKSAAELANHAKDRFLANMSHEIRTPMNGIIGMTQILEMTGIHAEQKSCVEIIKKSSKRLMSMVNNLLYLTTFEQGSIPVSNNEFRMAELISGVATEYEQEIREKNIKLSIAVDPLLRGILSGDSEKIAIILGQLVQNSVKFTDYGTILIKAEPASPGKEGRIGVRLSVADTGIGIRSEDIPKLFIHFSQLDDTDTKRYMGAGLGLAICKKLADACNWRMEIESTPGKGSTFSLNLELTLVTEILPDSHNKTSREKVLIADDDPASRKLLDTLCRRKSLETRVASNGMEAVEFCRREDFDLIFMDIQMPELDGSNASRVIREILREQGRKLPRIVAVTAYALSGDRDRFLQNGFDDYLPKPLDTGMFLDFLDHYEVS